MGLTILSSHRESYLSLAQELTQLKGYSYESRKGCRELLTTLKRKPPYKYFLIHYQNFNKLNFNFETVFSEISAYSATQTSDAVYVIGGRWTKDIVAEFKNDQWRRLANLNQGRQAHGSITVEGQTMIIGGYFNNQT